MLKSRKYKENKEKTDNLFGSIKEKCYFCKRVETFRGWCSKQSEVFLKIMAHPSEVFLKADARSNK